MKTKILGQPESSSDVVNKEPNVLLCGYGWVGQYMGKYFKTADYITADGIIRKVSDPKSESSFEHLEEGHYDLAVISVPTPMNPKTGHCDTSIVYDVVKRYKSYVKYFLIKSTVAVGTTHNLGVTFGVKIAMSPEYVGETLGHPLLEPRRDAFQIIGADDPEVADKIAEFFSLVLHASAPIYLCSSFEAEIIKYCENMWIMQRVDYWNDVYDICDTLGGSFQKVREGLVLDPRFSRTHSFVYPNNRGWSGKCLPKDMNELATTMRNAGNPLTTVDHQIEKNATKWRVKYDNKEMLKPIEEEKCWECGALEGQEHALTCEASMK